MKRLSLVLALAVAAYMASAPVASAATHHTKSSTAKLHAIKADGEVVSVDTKAKTATVKVGGEEMTHPVKGTAAIAELSKLKAGDQVHLTVMANAANEHQYISSIRPATGATKTVTSKKKSY